jgi:adenylate kinase
MDAKIVLLGAPGSGKGTQAKRLCQELGLTLISTGDLLREAVRNNTALGAKAKGFMDAGKLVPDELVIGLIKEKVTGLKGGFLLDGFPRNLEQAKMLDTIADIDLAVNLDVDEQIIVDRIVNRRSCKSCNEVYHLVAKPTSTRGPTTPRWWSASASGCTKNAPSRWRSSTPNAVGWSTLTGRGRSTTCSTAPWRLSRSSIAKRLGPE